MNDFIIVNENNYLKVYFVFYAYNIYKSIIEKK